MRLFLIAICQMFFLLGCAAHDGFTRQEAPQPQALATGSLRVSGVGLESRQFDAAALRALPRATVTAKEKDGTDAVYEGVRVADILRAAGMTFGHSLRGPRLADYLVAEAADGYRVVYALPELDAEFSDRVVIVADQYNGAALEGRDGPLKIIASDEHRHARWVRNVTALVVESSPGAN